MARTCSFLGGVRAAATFAALALVLPACHGSGPLISADPAAPIYRNADVRFANVKGIALHFVKVTTSNGEAVDLVTTTFGADLRGVLGPRFGPISEGTLAPPGGALLDVGIDVNWGSRSGRYFSMGMGGKAIITIDYELKDEQGRVLAKMHTVDQMSGGMWGGNAKDLVYAAASKWDRWFVDQVLVDAPH